MSDSVIQIPPDSTGKKLDTEQLDVSGNTVQRQRVQLAGTNASQIASILTTQPGSSTAGLTIRTPTDDIVPITLADIFTALATLYTGDPVKIRGANITDTSELLTTQPGFSTRGLVVRVPSDDDINNNLNTLHADLLDVIAAIEESGGGGIMTLHECRLTATANQTITNNTTTPLAFTSEIADTDSYHDNSSNNSRITIPTGLGGNYLILGRMQWDANADNTRRLSLRKNGSTIYARAEMVSYYDTAPVYQDLPATILSLAAGDYIELLAFQDCGANRSSVFTSSETPYFSAALLGT